jgi:hypothetical protein
VPGGVYFVVIKQMGKTMPTEFKGTERALLIIFKAHPTITKIHLSPLLYVPALLHNYTGRVTS